MLDGEAYVPNSHFKFFFFKGDIMNYITPMFCLAALHVCVCVCVLGWLSNDVLLHNCNWRPDDPNA